MKYLNRLLIAILVFFLWLLRFQMTRLSALDEGTMVRIRSSLREEPVVFGQTQSFSLRGVKIKARRFPEYHYGDYLIITGKIKARVITRFYQQYRLDYPEILPVEETQKPRLFSWIFQTGSKIEEVFDSVLPEPQASLLSGIVLGRKRRMGARFLEALKKTGTMHVVVASGANISLVSQPLVAGLAGFFSRKVALPLAFIFVWLYTLMAGFESPVVRAAIMASLGFLAQFFGREKDALRSLVLAGALMLLSDPLVIFDLGFQLSFAATLGILVFHPKIKPYCQKLPLLGNDLSTTLAAQVFVLPIIYFNFKSISFISPLVNAMVLWTISPLMQMGAMTAVSGLISRKIAQLLAYPAWLLLTFFVKVIELFG